MIFLLQKTCIIFVEIEKLVLKIVFRVKGLFTTA